MQVSTEIHINLDKTLESLSTNQVLKVGWVENNRYPEKDGGKYVAEIAAQNEYGAPHLYIPPRPFMAPAASENRVKWLSIFERGLKKCITGQTSLPDVFEVVGRSAASDIKKAIRSVTSPPLSPVTIEARKARYVSKGNKKKINPQTLEKPLIDTGIMFAAVTYAVENE